MGQYVIKRVLWTIPVLWLVATVTFVLMHSAPGSPWDAKSTDGRQLDPALEASFNRQYGLDEPILVQYGTYLKNAVLLDFGESYTQRGQTVTEIIALGFPYSAKIGVLALILALAIGLPVGIYAALRHNTFGDYASLFVTTISYTLPDFVIAIFLLIVFSVQFGWVPILFTDWRSYILPAVALGTGSAAFIARLTRSSVLEALQDDHVTTARAKGLQNRTVIARHVVRNSLIPVLTVVGPAFAGLITGTIIIERVFGVPGMGRLFIDSITSRDYPVIMGVTLFYAFIIVMSNLVVDIAYGFADPRIRTSQ
ncbi:MAG: ABC transporter permease [Chloroflexota bacterium]|nr:ABC transporter permease [Chloroflexota bacterium]